MKNAPGGNPPCLGMPRAITLRKKIAASYETTYHVCPFTCLAWQYCRLWQRGYKQSTGIQRRIGLLLFIQKQVGFGPRVPHTTAHRLCGAYLQQKLTALGGQVCVQRFQAQAFDGQQLQLENTIPSFQPTCA